MIQAFCGNLRELEGLINDELPPDQAARVIAHVETCKHCQLVLERLVTRPLDDPPSTSARIESETGSVAGPQAIKAEAQHGPPGRTATFPTGGSTGDFHPPSRSTDFHTHATSTPDTVLTGPIDTDADRDCTASQGDPVTDLRRGQGRSGNPVRIPGYELQRKLGEGGMGVVYLAHQTGLNRMVAVKMIRGGQHARPDHFARFRIEAEAVARLHHPNILQIHEIGTVDDLPFVSLELLDGGSLADRLDGTPQSGMKAAELLLTLAGAVQTAHVAGIVHRDLKPSNVLFTADGVPKITDFGLAKRMESDSRQTESGQIMGSPSYMAPEQARGHTKDVGPAADVYALGAILYELLTGRAPFKGETPMETVRQVIDDEVVPPSRLVPRVARDIETICLKCLNKEPSRRYASAAALADDLERYRNGETIQARRTPPHERVIKWARRRPATAVMLCLGAILFLGLPPIWMVRRDLLNRRVIEELRTGQRLLDSVGEARTRDELSSAQLALSTFLGEIKGEREPRLEGLPARIEGSLKRVKERLGELDRIELERRHELERQKGELTERERFRTFLRLRTQAQLDAAEFDLGTTGHDRLIGSTRAALAVYASVPDAPSERWELASPLPVALAEADKRRIVDGCYDLLLILSRVAEPARGLLILDQAARLHPEAGQAYHLRRADCLDRAGDVAGRDRELALARERPPVSSLDQFLLGRELATGRRWTEATAALENAVRLEPDQAAARLLLAICQYNMQPRRLGEALANLNDCIAAHPELTGLYLLRALVHGEKAHQSRFLKNEADSSFQAAEADYQTVLNRHPSDDLRYVVLVNRGGLYLRAGRLEDAITELESAIRLNSDAYQAHATLGQLFQQLDRLDEASAALGRAIARAPDAPTRLALRRGRARLFASRRHLPPDHRAAAIADLDEAIRLDPENGEPKASDHAERARLLFGSTRFEEALAACDAAIEVAPGLPSAHQLRISSLMALKRYGEVLGSCDAFLAREKPTVEVLEIRGLARLARRNYSGAIDDYTQAILLRPSPDAEMKARLLNRRGWAHHFADAPRLARDDFEASLKLKPDQSDALAGRGLARVRLGEWRPAVADAEASVRRAESTPTSPDAPNDRHQALFNAARIYAQAVEFVAGEVGFRGERAVALYRNYRNRALDLLERALRQVPDPVRRRELLDDPALRPLRFRRRTGETHQTAN